MKPKEPVKITKAFIKHLNKQMEKSMLAFAVANFNAGFKAGTTVCRHAVPTDRLCEDCRQEPPHET